TCPRRPRLPTFDLEAVITGWTTARSSMTRCTPAMCATMSTMACHSSELATLPARVTVPQAVVIVSDFDERNCRSSSRVRTRASSSWSDSLSWSDWLGIEDLLVRTRLVTRARMYEVSE